MTTTKRIRVAHLITNFAIGGAQDYMLLIVRGLDRKKYEPYIIGRMEGEWTNVLQSIPDVHIVDIPALRREVSLFNDVRSIFQIKKFCEENHIDILHTHSSKPGVVGRLGGTFGKAKAIVHTIHGFSFHEFMPRWKRLLFILIERSMYFFTTVLLLYSEQNKITANKLRIRAKRSVETFYYGIDYSSFEETPDKRLLRSSLGLNDNDYVIGFSGRFSEQKALHILISAFAKLYSRHPEIRLLLVGDGPLRKSLEAQARALGIQSAVHITGFRSDVPQLLRVMNLFVMTSLWEGLSRSLVEAMYAKLPVVATNVGGTSDAVRNDETGWLIEPNDVEDAARAILEAIENPSLAEQYAKRAYEWARTTFEVSKMHSRMDELYTKILPRNIDEVIRH